MNTQIVKCPDCGCEIKIVVRPDGTVAIVDWQHKS